jgi:hypothetical protein
MTMKEQKGFTLGQWEAKPETDYVAAQVWCEGRLLCDVFGESRAARKANAALIADAPRLYAENVRLREALLKIASAAQSWHDFHHGDDIVGCDEICEALPLAQAALKESDADQDSVTAQEGN